MRDFVLTILGSTMHIIGVPRFAIARRRQPIHFHLHVIAGAGHDLHLQPPFFTPQTCAFPYLSLRFRVSGRGVDL